ncbi:MAG TPA: hypothetical protein VHD36_06590 [Pirellulales bacterium]|nr:hypothetical protein [Pirellulales bacterium]
MSRRAVLVTTGSRLHFGLFAFGQPGTREFGGVGAMVDAPAVRLRMTAADRLSTEGPSAEIALRHAERVAEADWFNRAGLCRIEILETPPAHVGLGSGTQLALAVAEGMTALFNLPEPATAALAQTLGRGRRSAVGLYGFFHGGLIAEAGKSAESEVAPLLCRVPIPTQWRFLLVRQANCEGLSGEAERRAFEGLPAVSLEASARMCREAMLGLLPAAMEGRFDLFSQALYRYGQEAGRCFAPQQGGVFATSLAEATVDELRRLGVVGVAQSSWGPTIFAALPSEETARQVRTQLSEGPLGRDVTSQIVCALNEPARVEVLDG